MRRALVTGASSGIGEAFAYALAKGGYAVTLVARRKDKLEALLSHLPGQGHRVEVADLTQTNDLTRIAELFKGEHYNLLINNAGAGLYQWFSDTSLPDLEGMMRLNMKAVVVLSHAFLACAQSGDALMNVASVLATVPYPKAAMYSATKAFVLSLSESLWFREQARGVYVCALCPGITDTPFHQVAGDTPGEPLPPSITQTPEAVVAEALTALERRRKPVMVSGSANRFILFCSRFLSTKKLLRMISAL